jgi:hypothetical protein
MPQTTEDYRRHMHLCMEKAELSPSAEIHELWHTMASSYRFLLEREQRIEAQNLRPVR